MISTNTFRNSVKKFSSTVLPLMLEINNEELLEVHAQSLASQSFLARSDHFVMGDKIKVLDYGCGSGVVSESLQFNSNSILGALCQLPVMSNLS